VLDVKRYSDGAVLRLGAYTLVIMLIVMAAAFNLSKFPGFGGKVYHAEFTDASGLHPGNMVQIAGIRAGRVESISLEKNKVLVDFRVKNGYHFGNQSKASVEVLNLLGEKYLDLTPAGGGQLSTDATIPTSRTQSAYDIVGVLTDLTKTTEGINTNQLGQALETLGGTLNTASPEIRSSFRGISRLSRTIASRDAKLQTLLHRSDDVSKLLAARATDLTVLMRQASQVFRELEARKAAIHSLLVNARQMAVQLKGIADDNQRQIGPALASLHQVLGLLQSKEQQLNAMIRNLGPYASILGNIIGTGPWFDGYVVNMFGLPKEFQPGTGGQI
jgi:phospholipid/cholesterol/gamma-HCH transport system substrate-binding protein